MPQHDITTPRPSVGPVEGTDSLVKAVDTVLRVFYGQNFEGWQGVVQMDKRGLLPAARALLDAYRTRPFPITEPIELNGLVIQPAANFPDCARVDVVRPSGGVLGSEKVASFYAPSAIGAQAVAEAFVRPVKPRVVVVMEGGVVADVLSDKPVTVLAVDYDVAECDVSQLTPIPQSDGVFADAIAQVRAVGIDDDRVSTLFAAVAQHEARPACVGGMMPVAECVNYLASTFGSFDDAWEWLAESRRPWFPHIAEMAEAMADNLVTDDSAACKRHASLMAVANWAVSREGME